ncbi:hypothetical protein [Streptomyces sp. G1]|uniref:hypothetical protein n=1 Tax=Streptomyces sp. G1 TaxID=361572 RepID=UPI00202DCAFD|nr:hypothetical protein [Streptomyces sp. G1]MCM1969679.1 hypothetical protein [Streptomyces sp. G1]
MPAQIPSQPGEQSLGLLGCAGRGEADQQQRCAGRQAEAGGRLLHLGGAVQSGSQCLVAGMEFQGGGPTAAEHVQGGGPGTVQQCLLPGNVERCVVLYRPDRPEREVSRADGDGGARQFVVGQG